MAAKPDKVWHTIYSKFEGATKYYTVIGSSTYHADKYCHALYGTHVRMVESHEIATHADVCGHCTVEQPEFKDEEEKAKYR